MSLSKEFETDVKEREKGGFGGVDFQSADKFELLEGLDKERPARLNVSKCAPNVVSKGSYGGVREEELKPLQQGLNADYEQEGGERAALSDS